MDRSRIKVTGNVIDARRLFQERRELAHPGRKPEMLLLVRNHDRPKDASSVPPEFLWIETLAFQKDIPRLCTEGWQVFSTDGKPYLGTGEEDPWEILRNVLEKRSVDTAVKDSAR